MTKKSSQRFARGALIQLVTANKQREDAKDSVIPLVLKQNEQTAESFGYKHAACLCCDNHDTSTCNDC